VNSRVQALQSIADTFVTWNVHGEQNADAFLYQRG